MTEPNAKAPTTGGKVIDLMEALKESLRPKEHDDAIRILRNLAADRHPTGSGPITVHIGYQDQLSRAADALDQIAADAEEIKRLKHEALEMQAAVQHWKALAEANDEGISLWNDGTDEATSRAIEAQCAMEERDNEVIRLRERLATAEPKAKRYDLIIGASTIQREENDDLGWTVALGSSGNVIEHCGPWPDTVAESIASGAEVWTAPDVIAITEHAWKLDDLPPLAEQPLGGEGGNG